MRRCARSCHGAPKLSGERNRRGFTLLEMCLVLFIIALLMGTMMPAMESAFVERAVRNDAGQLALMVRTAMLQSSEQHRPYVIELTAKTMALHPLGDTPAEGEAPSSTQDEGESTAKASPENVVVASQINPSNKLLVPDPRKANVWVALPPTSWLFEPGELCPATRVRFSRGSAWVEMSFNALTGNVENEASYFP